MNKNGTVGSHKTKETLSPKEWMTGLKIYLQVKTGRQEPGYFSSHSRDKAKKAYEKGYTYDYYANYLMKNG